MPTTQVEVLAHVEALRARLLSPFTVGALTTISVEMGGEMFSASGTQVLERNFLDVYPWTKWNTNLLPNFQVCACVRARA